MRLFNSSAWFLAGLALGAAGSVLLSTRPAPPPPAPQADLESSLFYAPTAPLSVQQMLPESASAACVVVAMPEEQVIANSRKMDFFVHLIEAAAAACPVVILVNREEPDAILRITREIARRCPASSPARERVSFQRAVIDTEWVRDYAPLFGVGTDRRLILFDNMYRDARSESATERMLLGAGMVKVREGDGGAPWIRSGDGGRSHLSDYGHYWRRNDDAAPIYFNEIVHSRNRRFSPLVRTPLELSGGDVYFTRAGVMLTLTRTLEINGGDERRFVQCAKDYFGVKQVLFLKPLPRGMWHLDMFLKIGESDTILLGQVVEERSESLGDLDLVRGEMREILEWNCDLVRRFLPESRIVRVPMPPLMSVATDRGTARTGVAELDSAVAAGAIRMKPQMPVLYRSFVNSLVIRGPSGYVVLLPRFTGLGAIEPEVERAYREAWPGAALHFVEADVLTEEFGGIHCVAAILPALD